VPLSEENGTSLATGRLVADQDFLAAFDEGQILAQTILEFCDVYANHQRSFSFMAIIAIKSLNAKG
jgi:hypothetical protein